MRAHPDFFNDLAGGYNLHTTETPVWDPEPLVVGSAEWDGSHRNGYNFNLSLKIGDGASTGKVPLTEPKQATLKFIEAGVPGKYKLDYRFRNLAALDHDPLTSRYLHYPYLSSVLREAEADPLKARQEYGNVGFKGALFAQNPGGYFNWGADHEYDLGTTSSRYVGKLLCLAPEIEVETDHIRKFVLETATIKGLDLIVEAAGPALLPHLGRAISYLWIKDFIEQQLEFIEAVHIVELLSSQISSIYRNHARIGLDGSKDIRKVQSQVEKLIKRESMLDRQKEYLVGSVAALVIKIYERTKEEAKTSSLPVADKGQQFEAFVAEKFRELGYVVEVTPVTGDFGADLLVEKEELRFVVQCKNLSVPAGVKAVQEVTAARRRYGCDFAVVVSSQGHTSAAYELARDNDVILRTPDNLTLLDPT